MFYDDAFRNITENSPFSTEGKIEVNGTEYVIGGILCSGSYGQKDFDKGYSLAKTLKRQSFKVSLSSLPEGIGQEDILRKTMTIDGKAWVIDEITGNNSGILNLSLKGRANA